VFFDVRTRFIVVPFEIHEQLSFDNSHPVTSRIGSYPAS
jgi:hypothetical protein